MSPAGITAVATDLARARKPVASTREMPSSSCFLSDSHSPTSSAEGAVRWLAEEEVTAEREVAELLGEVAAEREVAELLGLEEGHCRMVLSRAMAKLSAKLQP